MTVVSEEASPHQSKQELRRARSEEHTSELQSPCNLVCRLLLEKTKERPACLVLVDAPRAGPLRNRTSRSVASSTPARPGSARRPSSLSRSSKQGFRRGPGRLAS